MSRYKGYSVSFQLMDVRTGKFEGEKLKVVVPASKVDLITNTVILTDAHGKWYVARRGGSAPTTLNVGYTSNPRFKQFNIRNL